MKKILFVILLFTLPIFAQDKTENTNSFFDDSETKEYSLQSILVEGEVENPGAIELTALPLYSFPVKELGDVENGKQKFTGAFYYSGYSLFDILNSKKVKKANENEFRPYVDLYVVVENENGDKAVFSWGEIYYSKDNFQIMISKSVSAINPSKMKMKWQLSGEPKIICKNDISSARCIVNPTKITVKSADGKYSTERLENIFSPEIQIIAGGKLINVSEEVIKSEKRKYHYVGYGHGMGFKGVNDIEGYLLKDVLASQLDMSDSDIGSSLVIVSAKDGYRCTYSLSEILDRNNCDDFILIDNGDSPKDGRFSLFTIADFFVDRNVRAVEKINIVNVK